MHLDKQLARELLKANTFDPCTICSMPMISNKCKIVCMNCGFKRDCSDQ